MKTTIFFIAIISYPATVRAATPGHDIVDAFLTFLYSIITGLLLLCFIIYSIVKLKSKKKPKKKQGKIVFLISIILIVPTIIIAFNLIKSSNWSSGSIEVMLVFFGPLLLLSIISAVLAKLLMKSFFGIDNNK